LFNTSILYFVGTVKQANVKRFIQSIKLKEKKKNIQMKRLSLTELSENK